MAVTWPRRPRNPTPMRTRTSLLALAALSACIGLAPLTAQATPAENDAAMLKLATDRGCMECHSIERLPKRADGMPPTMREIGEQLRDGKSLEQIAQSKGKTAAEVIAAARTSVKAQLDKAVANGRLTQQPADQALAQFDAQAPT